MNINIADIGKDGKCPICAETFTVLSETDDLIRWECTSCEKTFQKELFTVT